ncbi:MAG: TrkA C-terminal domain-containing protein [Erysipelotrichaceae bacterium]|nr:TrkA C-terminal domain-containing protein [Erysipelotrichaceae bacterium]
MFLFLTFFARPIIVWLLIHRFQLHWNQMFIISLAGLKGASSIVFAIMIAVSTTFNTQFLFNIVFLIVLYSILIQGMILPYASKKYHMLDDSSDVLKTFNDYVEELPVQSIPIKIKENHSWKNQLVKDIILPMDTLLVSVNRNNEQITPDGNFKIEVNDIVILVTKVVTNTKPIHLEEVIIDKEHRWVHKTLSEISFKKNQLVIFIIRDDKLVIPNGKTMIMEDDIVIMKD